MLWRVTLAVALVCVGSIPSCARADLMSRLILQRDYGVKLCGREFIRAVIFTCGGSRWRRSPDFDSFPWTPVSHEHSWNPPLDSPPLSSSSFSSSSSSLDDLLAVYRSNRKRSNVSLGVAGKCCSQGCSKNDIGRLC